MDDCEIKFKRRCKKLVVHYEDEDEDEDQSQDEKQQFDDCEPNVKRLRRRCNQTGAHQQQHQYSNWSDLPTVLLFEIVDKLIFADDYVRFGAVCVSWQNAYKLSSTSTMKFPSLPFLLIPPHDYNYEEEFVEHEEDNTRLVTVAKIQQVRSLYNLVTKKICSNLQVPLSSNKYCRGSSFGWLVTTQKDYIKEQERYIWYVQLLNPFLSNKHKHNIIDIPPIYKNKKLMRYDDSQPRDFYIHKAILSSDPLLTPKNFVLMAIMTKSHKLGFYTPQNKDWTPVCWYLEESQGLCFFEDVIYFNKTQQFYAVLGGTGQVVTVDLVKTRKGHIVPKLTKLASPTHHADDAYRDWYLVETSSGELLQVAKILEYGEERFEVYKFDPVGQVWNQIRDIGDAVLFIGFNSSICRLSSDLPGCKSNSIYYTNDQFLEYRRGYEYGSHDAGIYNIEDGSTEEHYPMASRVNFPTPIWLEPTLGRCNHFQYMNEM